MSLSLKVEPFRVPINTRHQGILASLLSDKLRLVQENLGPHVGSPCYALVRIFLSRDSKIMSYTLQKCSLFLTSSAPLGGAGQTLGTCQVICAVRYTAKESLQQECEHFVKHLSRAIHDQLIVNHNMTFARHLLSFASIYLTSSYPALRAFIQLCPTAFTKQYGFINHRIVTVSVATFWSKNYSLTN